MFLLSDKIQNLLNRVALKKSLRIIFFSIFLIPVIIISCFLIVFQYKTITNWEIEKVHTSLTQTEQAFTNTLSEIRSFSDRLYVNKQIQNVLLKKYSNVQDIYSDYANLTFLEDYLHTYNIVANYRIFTENKTILDNQFIIKASDTTKFEDWYVKAVNMHGQAFWQYKKDSLSNKFYLSLIRSIWSSTNGLFVGVLVINISPEVLQRNIKSQVYDTIIALDKKIVYSTTENLSEQDKSNLIDFISQNDYSESKIKRVVVNDEKVGIIAVDFKPKNSDALNFKIMYLIPVRQFVNATLTILMFAIVEVFILIILSSAVIMLFSSYIDGRVYKINKEIKNVIENNFEIAEDIGGNDEFEQIYKAVYKMSQNIKELIETVYLQELENEKIAVQQSEMSFKMLANQINPHFLFNTLETIRMKSLASGDKDVSTMLKLLASLLRYNLSIKGQPVPLINELNAIQSYLTIQHMRFGERVSYDVVTMCDIQQINILPLLIQPLVENSFSHGLEDKVSGGFIYVLINSDVSDGKNDLIITVRDNGCGIDPDKLKELNEKFNYENEGEASTSIGLVNVNSRIKLYYGNEYGLSIKSDFGEGTEVTIRIKAK